MSDEQAPNGTEHIRVIFPNPLEMANLRDYPAEIIRAVAQAANECGLEGKRIEGLIFTTPRGQIAPEVVFEVRPKTFAEEMVDHLMGKTFGS